MASLCLHTCMQYALITHPSLSPIHTYLFSFSSQPVFSLMSCVCVCVCAYACVQPSRSQHILEGPSSSSRRLPRVYILPAMWFFSQTLIKSPSSYESLILSLFINETKNLKRGTLTLPVFLTHILILFIFQGSS